MPTLPNNARLPHKLLTGLATLLLAGVGVAQPPGHVRRLPLDGAPNFRDIGGYATADGRHVRWGQVYRSGQLSQLTVKDYEYLARRGISTVCDFRRDDERRSDPTQWKGPNPPEIPLLPTPGRNGPTTMELLAKGAGAAEMVAFMRATYERIVVIYAPSYGAAFQRILNGTGPTLYHCSAGKDRTGVFSAMLLLFLGVPRETAFADYLLSNDYAATAQQVNAAATGLKASPDAVRAVYMADRAYLDAALQTIERDFRSLDNYRRTELRLSDQDLVRLKVRLLEK